jgi:hypothetical protein
MRGEAALAAQREQKRARKLADRAQVAETRVVLAVHDLPMNLRLLVLNSVLRSELARAREQDARQGC